MAIPPLRDLIQRLRGDGLAAESAWGLVVEVATLATTVMSFLFLGRSLGAAGYGGYASLYAIAGPLVTLAASGIVLAVLQHIVRDGEALPGVARSCLSLSIALGALLTLIGTGVASLLIDTISLVAIVSILLTEFVAAPLVHVSAGVVQAGTGYIDSAKIRLVLIVGRGCLLIVLFVGGVLSIATLGVSMLVLSTLLGVRALRGVGRRYGFTFTPGRVRMSHLKTNLVYSAAISAAGFNADGDKLVMAANKLVVDTGLYAAAYRIVSFGLIPVGSLVSATHRRFLEHEEGVRRQHLDRALRFGLIAGSYGFVFGIFVFLAAPYLPLLMGEEFEGSVPMVRWLAPTVLMRALAIFPLNGLMGIGREGLRTVMVVVNAGIAMTLYVVLIPIYGWEGAAIGTLISETIAASSTWIALVIVQRNADRRLDAAGASG